MEQKVSFADACRAPAVVGGGSRQMLLLKQTSAAVDGTGQLY